MKTLELETDAMARSAASDCSARIKILSPAQMRQARMESSERFKKMTEDEIVEHFTRDRNWCRIGDGLKWYAPQRHD